VMVTLVSKFYGAVFVNLIVYPKPIYIYVLTRSDKNVGNA